MSYKARSMWEAFITAPANAALLKRYAKSAQEPVPLFESIGEDLGSSNEEVRKGAFWALVAAMPELTNILHERETRQPGWRDVEGKDQQMVNRGMDIVSYLHLKLVKEHRFKIRDGYGRDPRPYVNKAMENRKRDEERKRKNSDGTLKEVPLDYEAALEIPDLAGSLEDGVLEKIAFEERKRELRDWGFYRSDDELALLETVYVDDAPLTEVLESNGVSSVALRKRLSRIRQRAVKERDELFTSMLTAWHHFGISGKIPRFRQYPEQSEWWVNRAKSSIQPGPWADGKAADGKNAVAIRALTRGFRHSPGHIYLVALHKDCWRYTYEEAKRKRLAYEEAKKKLLAMGSFKSDSQRLYRALLGLYDACSLDHSRLEDAHKLIDSTRGLKPGRYVLSLLRVYPTELSSLNEAIAEIRDAYVPCLMSNAKQNKYYVDMDD